MLFEELRTLWLVLLREYLERVKSISFLVTTFAAPALFVALAATPILFTTPRSIAPKRIMVVCSAAEPARQIADAFTHWKSSDYRAEMVTNASQQERARLVEMVRESRIEGFLWLDKAAIDSGRVVYTSLSGLDTNGGDDLRSIIFRALVRARLAARGVSHLDIERALQPVTLDVVPLPGAAASKSSDGTTMAILVTVTIITILEMSLLSYGIIVMRSVLEDKTSRMVEILLCSVTPRALMAGKLLGIGGLSLTQVMIWGVMMAGAGIFVGRMAGPNPALALTLGLGSVAMFAVFYVLGYLLYSSVYAALGAAFNSADEAQYWSFILTLPLLFAGIAAWSLLDQPNSAMSVVLSLAPPLAPVIMSMRIATGTAPTWQIGLSVILMSAAIYGAWLLSARIYRVGTLMYGKKPSLREISRWLRYA